MLEMDLPEIGWKETCLKIINGDNGDLVFQMEGTPYYGVLDDLEVRI